MFCTLGYQSEAMRATLTLFFLLFAAAGDLNAQQSVNIGLAAGATNYFGDLGNDEFFQGSSLSPGMSLTVRNLVAPHPVSGRYYSPFDIEARISWHRIQYDEAVPIGDRLGSDLRNYNRGLNFRNDLLGLSTHFSYTYYPSRRLPLHRQPLALFVYTGVGVYYGRPKGDLFRGEIDMKNRYYHWSDGTLRDAPESSGRGNEIDRDGEYETDLMEWRTEGQGALTEGGARKKAYSPFNIGIPMAMGFRCGVSRNITLSVEFGYYRFFTDYLDDVSDAYATYKEIELNFPDDAVRQEIARYISDPTGLGTNGIVGPATSRRGNPAVNDSYSFINLEVAYKLNWASPRLTALFDRR